MNRFKTAEARGAPLPLALGENTYSEDTGSYKTPTLPAPRSSAPGLWNRVVPLCCSQAVQTTAHFHHSPN